MAKRWLALLMALGIVFTLQVPVFAADRQDRDRNWVQDRDSAYARGGFYGYGDFSQTKVGFGFLTDDEDIVMVYNKEADIDPVFTRIWAGSDLYLPIGVLDEETGGSDMATDKQIKENDVAVSYKALVGSQYVEDVTIVSGKKEKIDGLESGMYAKISFSDYAGTSYANVDLMLVLSVNKKSCQETRVNLVCNLHNYWQTIDRNSVYSAYSPSQFTVRAGYNGEATFDFGGNIKYTARVDRGAKYYLHLDREENEAIAAMYNDGYQEYYRFVGDNNSFASLGRLEIPIDQERFKGDNGKVQVYVYEVVNDQLRSLGKDVLSYDNGKKLMTLRTQDLGEYVLSNQALMQEVENDQWDVIQTGYATPLNDSEEEGEEEEMMPSSADPANENPPMGGAVEQETMQLEWKDEEETGEEAEESSTAQSTYIEEDIVPISSIINADNASGYNPPTGDGNRPIAAILIGCGALLVAIVLLLTRNKA